MEEIYKKYIEIIKEAIEERFSILHENLDGIKREMHPYSMIEYPNNVAVWAVMETFNEKNERFLITIPNEYEKISRTGKGFIPYKLAMEFLEKTFVEALENEETLQDAFRISDKYLK
jgi:hypothetical protein